MIGIIVLNYLNYKVTINCVESILDHPPTEDFHVFIIDNGSGNESGAALTEKYKNNNEISVELLPSNIGFAAGNNYGIELCKKMDISECVLTNSDILFEAGSIQKLIDDVRDMEAVIVGPKIIGREGGIQQSSRLKRVRLIDVLEIGRFLPQKRLDEKGEKGIHDVFSVSGCCFSVNISHFTNMGAFDESTFLYNEENILGIQAEKTGYRICIDLDVQVKHEHGASSGAENDFVRSEYIKSTLYYWHIYRGKGQIVLNMILYAFLFKLKLQRNKNIHPDRIRKVGRNYIMGIMKRVE